MTSQFWVKQKGYPWWPARASSEGDAPEDVLRKRPKSCVLVQYYQSDDYLWCNPEGKEVVEYGQGKAHDTHAEAAQKGQNQKLKRAVFLAEQAREQQHRGSSSRKHRSGQADTSSAKRKRPAEPAEQPAQSSSSGFSEADWTVGVKVKASFKVPKQRAKWFTGSITDAASSDEGWCISVHFHEDGSDEDYVLPRDIDDIKLVATSSEADTLAKLTATPTARSERCPCQSIGRSMCHMSVPRPAPSTDLSVLIVFPCSVQAPASVDGREGR